MTPHDELVLKAGWWLRERARCCPVLLEPGYGNVRERADAIGWRSGVSTLIECKATRADFLSDRAKLHRADGRGMGVRRYYLVIGRLVGVEEVPEGWGLLQLRGSRVFVLREPEPRALDTRDLTEELRLLAGAMANVQYRARGFEDFAGRHADHNLGPSPYDEFMRGRDEGWDSAERHAERWGVG